jgi:hypothetical protein
MESNYNSSDDLNAIRMIMEKSTRFFSLSGLSGVFSGTIALVGAAVALFVIQGGNPSNGYLNNIEGSEFSAARTALFIDAIATLILAVSTALYLSRRKAARLKTRIWSPVSKSMLLNVIIPLLTGGIFILFLNHMRLFSLIAPSMLIFYGLALVNAGKFTYNEIFYLGLSEIVTGFLSMIIPDYGLYFWAFGFGVLHIVYGFVMYRRYER